jgi:glucose-1-phosphate thymidylyltransferase
VDHVVGLIPCAGRATRLAPLPCSKEVLPIEWPSADGDGRIRVVSEYLIDRMRRGGVRKAFLILRQGKWDIAEYYRDGAIADIAVGYLVAGRPFGPPYSLDQAFEFVREATVALGFPDILLGPADAFAQALSCLRETGAQIVLGLFRPQDPRVTDMIELDAAGHVRDLVIKPEKTGLEWTWMFAVWTPAFTSFLHGYLTEPRTSAQAPGAGLPDELTVGHVIQAAIRSGLSARAVTFPRGDYLDIGTPEGLRQCLDPARRRALGIERMVHDSADHAAVVAPAPAADAAGEDGGDCGAAVDSSGTVGGRADLPAPVGALPGRL